MVIHREAHAYPPSHVQSVGPQWINTRKRTSVEWGKDEPMRGSVITTSITSLTRRGGPEWSEKKRGGEGRTARPMPPNHCVTKVVLFVGARRDSDKSCGSSLCRSRSKEAGTAELRAESDDADERIGEARFRTWGRGGNEEDGV